MLEESFLNVINVIKCYESCSQTVRREKLKKKNTWRKATSVCPVSACGTATRKYLWVFNGADSAIRNDNESSCKFTDRSCSELKPSNANSLVLIEVLLKKTIATLRANLLCNFTTHRYRLNAAPLKRRELGHKCKLDRVGGTQSRYFILPVSLSTSSTTLWCFNSYPFRWISFHSPPKAFGCNASMEDLKTLSV